MKLSELLQLNQETASAHPLAAQGVFGLSFYGVEVDDASDLTPPEWLKEIGILLKVDEDGQLNEDVLDVAISYRLSKVKVLMEVPFEIAKQVNEEHLISSVATNMQVALSFLPPEEDSEEAFQAYVGVLRQTTKAFLGKPNVDQMVMPITNYLEYLFVNLLAPDRPFQVKDVYVKSAFVEQMTPERVDALKEEIRAEVYAHFGGKEGFENVGKGLMSSFYKETVAIAGNIKEHFEKKKDTPTAPV